jgi:hypothetical protein
LALKNETKNFASMEVWKFLARMVKRKVVYKTCMDETRKKAVKK